MSGFKADLHQIRRCQTDVSVGRNASSPGTRKLDLANLVDLNSA